MGKKLKWGIGSSNTNHQSNKSNSQLRSNLSFTLPPNKPQFKSLYAQPAKLNVFKKHKKKLTTMIHVSLSVITKGENFTNTHKIINQEFSKKPLNTHIYTAKNPNFNSWSISSQPQLGTKDSKLYQEFSNKPTKTYLQQ